VVRHIGELFSIGDSKLIIGLTVGIDDCNVVHSRLKELGCSWEIEPTYDLGSLGITAYYVDREDWRLGFSVCNWSNTDFIVMRRPYRYILSDELYGDGMVISSNYDYAMGVI